MTLEQFVAEAKRLRAEADHAEERFLEFLYQGEHTPNLWQGSGQTFEEFIERENICVAIRYIKYKRVRKNVGVPGVGTWAIMAASKLTAADDQREVIAEARLWERTNQTTISERTAKEIASSVRTRNAARAVGHKRYQTIAEENVELRAKLAEAEETIKVLRAELRDARRQLRAQTKKKRKSKASA
jgi:hypothetical protein